MFLAPLNFNNCMAAVKTTPENIRYILLKVIDSDSGRGVNSAAITVNKRIFLSSSPSGLVKLDLHLKELKDFDFLDIYVCREGYFETSLEVSIKEPSKIKQPIKIRMKQRMGVVTGEITGCWSDKDGHYIDSYANEEIKVFGTARSSQHIIYKFNADQKGNFKIFNLPLGTYEIDIRHKKWTIIVNFDGEQINREFNIRRCNREQYHKKDSKNVKNQNLNDNKNLLYDKIKIDSGSFNLDNQLNNVNSNNKLNDNQLSFDGKLSQDRNKNVNSKKNKKNK